MSNRKLISILLLLIIILASFRLPWAFPTKWHGNVLKADQGILDVSGWDFNQTGTVYLGGEWELYPNSYLNIDEIEKANNKIYIPIVGNWNDYIQNETQPDVYGTYRLRIAISEEQSKQQFKIKIPHKRMVSTVIADDQIIISNANKRSAYQSNSDSFLANEQNEINIILHVSEKSAPNGESFAKLIKFGNENTMDWQHTISMGMQFLVLIVGLLHFVYAVIIALISRQRIEYIYFAMLALCVAVETVLDDDRILLHWVDIDFDLAQRLLYLSYLGVAAFALLFIQNLFSDSNKYKWIRLFYYSHLLTAILTFLTPVRSVFTLIYTVNICTFVFIGFLMWEKVKKDDSATLFILLAAASGVLTYIWPFYKFRASVELSYYPVDIIIAFLAFSVFLFKRYIDTSKHNEKLTYKLQAEIEQKDVFLVNTSHELRNPLHGIINIIQSILQNKSDQLDIESKKNVELVASIGIHMSHTLNDLLDISRLKEHQIQLHKEPLHLQSVTTAVVDILKFMFENKNVQLELHISRKFPEVVADKNRLMQILFNLLHNAMKFTNDGVITIGAVKKGKMAHIYVADTGIGIDPETMSRIFEPYEQGAPSQTSISGGLGLGLNISKQLIELHGGTLKVSSTIGEGSVFTFTLPIADDKSMTLEPGLSENEVLVGIEDPLHTITSIAKGRTAKVIEDRPKVLVVGNDPVNLKVLSSVLTNYQYELESVTTGWEALKQLDLQEWDLVISEVVMEGISGYELTRKIREKYDLSELPVLLLTARNQPEDTYTGFLVGANDYLIKPVDALELSMRVHALTDLKASVNERLQMEAAWLQAQIQPHFLYNTLNTIISLSEIDTTRMANLLENFGSYLRRSFDSSNLNRLVSLEHELELVKSYVFIEKERFGDRLKVEWEIDYAEHIAVPPMTIQTIVENAINHGVLKKVQGGTVKIGVQEVRGYWEITIQDDGVGMTDEKMKQIFSPHKEVNGIGLPNTDKRLQRIYGEGLTIKSTLDEGTIVSFRVPKIKITNESSI